jgi:hypothetical protein
MALRRVEAEYFYTGGNNLPSLADNKPFHVLVHFQNQNARI